MAKSTFPHVEAVWTNIKSVADGVKLSPKTLIVGDNGSGKSTICDAITLALSGTGDAVAHKDGVKMGVALMALKNREIADDEPLSAEVDIAMPDGSTEEASISISGDREAAKEPIIIRPRIAGEFSVPLRSLRSTLATGSQDRIRSLFIDAIEDGVGMDDVVSRLGSQESRDFFNGCDSAKDERHPHVMSILQSAIEEAEKAKRAANAAAKALEGSAPSIGKIPTAAELEKAEAALESAKVATLAASKNVGRQEVVSEQRATTKVHPVTAALVTVLEEVVNRKSETCPTCLGEADVSVFAARLEKLRAMASAAVSKPTLRGVPGPTAESKAASAKLEAAILAEDTARRALSSLQIAKEEYEAADQNRESLSKAKIDADKFKRIEGELKACRDALIQSGAEALEKAVQKFLPAKHQFKIVLNQGDRRVCYFGFARGNSVDVALSAGESVLVLIALCCALATQPEKNLHVAIPPDCSMSGATLIALMEATANAPIQIILTTTTDPGRIPHGWTRIRTPL